MNYYITTRQDELYHFGVKGMKWGVRNDNPNYSAEQRRRDAAVYGRTGVRRINRSMNKGDSISAARSREADRIRSYRRAATTGGKIGSVVGGIAGSAAAHTMLQRHGSESLKNNSLSIQTGAAAVGSTLGRRGGQSIVMIAGGYSPKKFRYD